MHRTAQRTSFPVFLAYAVITAAAGLTLASVEPIIARTGSVNAQARTEPTRIDLAAIERTIAELGLRYQVADNWVVRLGPQQRRRLGGARVPDDSGLLPDCAGPRPDRLPAVWDWRDVAGHSYVSGVRHQGSCGACWAFAAVSMLESALMIARGEPDSDLNHAEQYVLSCIDIPGFPSGCGGGYLNAALEFLTLAGAPSESCFPYEANDGLPCAFACPDLAASLQKLQSWSYVTTSSLSLQAIKSALAVGPVATWFRIHNSFYGYASGVYSAYGSPYSGVSHFALIVGFDDDQQCWIAKNSWGTGWGEDGYFRMAYDSGCDFGLWTQACSYAADWSEAVAWFPAPAAVGDTLSVSYAPAGRPLAGSGWVLLHRGHNGWQQIVEQPMVWDTATLTWRATFPVPAGAHTVEFAFRSGSDWDDNGGTDWIVPVSGASDLFAMDGYLDANARLLAATDEVSLFGRWLGPILYVACEGTGSTLGLDHFLVVLADSMGAGPAPWSKSGTMAPWAFLLGAENDTGWSGWFDGTETILAGPSCDTAQGPYLEGILDLQALYAGAAPTAVRIAAARYDSPDGGNLRAQAPAGNGDGDLQFTETVALSNPATGIADRMPPRPDWNLVALPNPFNPLVELQLTLANRQPVRLEVFDLSGKKLAVIHAGPAGPGPERFRWDGRNDRGRPCPSGVYLFRAVGTQGGAKTEALLLK